MLVPDESVYVTKQIRRNIENGELNSFASNVPLREMIWCARFDPWAVGLTPLLYAVTVIWGLFS